jgi:hypothetical protein
MSVVKGYGCFDSPALVDWEVFMSVLGAWQIEFLPCGKWGFLPWSGNTVRSRDAQIRGMGNCEATWWVSWSKAWSGWKRVSSPHIPLLWTGGVPSQGFCQALDGTLESEWVFTFQLQVFTMNEIKIDISYGKWFCLLEPGFHT